MWEFDPGYNEASVPKHFLAIYWNNLDTSQKDYGEYTILPDLMEVMSYAAEELDDDKIPALVADDRTFTGLMACGLRIRENISRITEN